MLLGERSLALCTDRHTGLLKKRIGLGGRALLRNRGETSLESLFCGLFVF